MNLHSYGLILEKKHIEDFDMQDIKLVDYKHHGTIKAPVAV